ncbi:hypothetical protein [Aeromonas caviae]|uniref:hypothetical protein n=1 Tax=Aeromonas caviae TaxID=648 RepID=UPI0029DB51B5|nr:hypothetical protein [Aeromonas caviae]MDX7810943.1 hypothetical protein [Aeromonas caviae]
MFFSAPPIVQQGPAPLPTDVLLMRAAFLASAGTLKQTLAANDVAQTIQFNTASLPDADLTVDLGTGEVTSLKAFSGMVSISCSILREQSGMMARWGLFIEVLNVLTSTWDKVPGSLRPLTLPSADTNVERFIDLTFSVSLSAGQKFRFRHFTDQVSRQVSLVAQAATATLPSSAAAVMSFWGIKP